MQADKSQLARLYRFDAAGRAFSQSSELGGWMGCTRDGRHPAVRADRGSFERRLVLSLQLGLLALFVVLPGGILWLLLQIKDRAPNAPA
jgi:hypothetical protein